MHLHTLDIVHTTPSHPTSIDLITGVSAYLNEDPPVYTIPSAPILFPATTESLLHPYDVLLDNQAEIHLFGNRNLLTNIKKIQNPITATGIGSLQINHIGTFPGINQTVYYNPQSPVNVLSFSKLRDNCKEACVGYDYKSNTFWAKINGSVKIFKRLQSSTHQHRDFYVCRFGDAHEHTTSDDSIESNALFFPQLLHSPNIHDTVQLRKSTFSAIELQQAKEARILAYKLVIPNTRSYIDLIKHSAIINTAVTTADVRRYAYIHGPETAHIMGTATNAPATPNIRPLDITTPVDVTQQNQRLSVDLFTIDKLLFLLTHSTPCGYTKVTYISTKDVTSIWKSLNNHVVDYHRRGFKIID